MVTGDLSDLLVKRAERAEAELMSTRAALKIANATIATLMAQAALDKSEIESWAVRALALVAESCYEQGTTVRITNPQPEQLRIALTFGGYGPPDLIADVHLVTLCAALENDAPIVWDRG